MSDDHVVLGFDGGGSRTNCVALGPDLVVRARGEGGPSNLHSSGIKQTEHSLRAALVQCLEALKNRGHHHGDVAGVCVAMAGAGRAEEQRHVTGILRNLLASGADGIQIDVVPDVYGALVGGAETKVGTVVVVGTGSMVWRRDRSGASTRAGGWGYLMGDEGSGYDLGRKALQAAMKADDGRGPHTRLTSLLVHHFHIGHLGELVKPVYDPSFSVRDVAALAPLVLQAADAGDEVGVALLDAGSRELACGVRAVHTALGAATTQHVVVLAGGLMRHAGYRQRVADTIVSLVPTAQPLLPRRDAAEGAAMLSAESQGWWQDT